MKWTLSFCWLLMLSLLVQCAKPGNPTGGPQDSIPPRLINASPKLNTVQFDKSEIRLTFDEYISLKDLSKQLIVSPPLERDKYTVYPQTGAAKKVTIVLKDSLLKNTTYTFNFGESIVDYNESNPLPYFTYVFSTGREIDSLTLKGRVFDAFEKDTERFVSLQLYPIDSTYTDSTIYTKKPFYVTNTLDTLLFEFKNLKAGKYQLIALQDVGSNYLFDQATDKIGFLSAPISLPNDSLITLNLFKEKQTFAWADPSYVNDHHVYLGYYGEYEDPKFDIVTPLPKEFTYLVNRNRMADSLNFWFKGPALDSLQFSFPMRDTLLTKTVYLKQEEPLADSLVVSAETKGNLSLTTSYLIGSNLPIIKTDSTKVSIFGKDSIPLAVGLRVIENFDRIALDFKVLPNDNYNITLFPEALIDFMGNTNDTLNFKIATKKIEDYGNLFIRLKYDDPEPFILQVLDNSLVVKRFYDTPNTTGVYEFPLLDAGSYYVRLIKDVNGNKQWDTGDYLKGLQPEPVIYLLDPLTLSARSIELRANWDLNESFNVTQNYLDLLKIGTVSEVFAVPENLDVPSE
ncbi:MAG: Ig-like domain-containing protein [Flavobacteriaceae bacterium]